MCISKVVYEHDVPSEVIISLDKTLLSYILPGKHTFSIKGTKNASVKGIDDKRQITATTAVFQFTQGTWKDAFQTLIFDVISTWQLRKIIGPTWRKLSSILKKSFFHPFIKPKTNVFTPEQMPFVMDTFKGQDNEILEDLCAKKMCKVVIFPSNFSRFLTKTSKFCYFFDYCLTYSLS